LVKFNNSEINKLLYWCEAWGQSEEGHFDGKGMKWFLMKGEG
jgi:hypothetical protein